MYASFSMCLCVFGLCVILTRTRRKKMNITILKKVLWTNVMLSHSSRAPCRLENVTAVSEQVFLWRPSVIYLRDHLNCVSPALYFPVRNIPLSLETFFFLRSSFLKFFACGLFDVWFVYFFCTDKKLILFCQTPNNEHFVHFHTLTIYVLLIMKDRNMFV